VTLLRTLGCDEVQGFLWSPPLPAEECEPLLAAGVLPAQTLRREGSDPLARGRGKRR
jgi:predicted signal transduction protein with EAL and GGDEF domain